MKCNVILQFSVSRDLLGIITIYSTLKKHVWLLSLLKTILLLHILCGNGEALYFSEFFDKYSIHFLIYSIHYHVSNILITCVNAFIK